MQLRSLKPSFVLSIIVIILLGIIMLLPSQFIFTDINLQQRLTDITPSGYSGMLFLFFTLALLTSAAFPRQIAAFMCGYSFGFTSGVIIATLATTLGCYITFVTSKKHLTKWVNKRWYKQQQSISIFLKDKLFYKAIVIRILPIGSNFLTNIIAGSCSMPTKPYMLGSFIGFIPQMVIFSLAGAGIKLGSSVHLLISGILFIVAATISLWLYKRSYIKNKSEISK